MKKSIEERKDSCLGHVKTNLPNWECNIREDKRGR